MDIRTIFIFNNEELYEKIQGLTEIFKDIFESYAMIGEKTDTENLSFSGYIKFLSDCELILENQDILHKKGLRRIKSDAKLNLSNSTSTDPNNINNQKNIKSVHAKSSVNIFEKIPKGKIKKSDVYIIYNYICGLRNFDSSVKIKNQFDKNKGIINEFQNCFNVPSLEEKSYLNSNTEVKLLKMNFPIFLKSLEYISRKIRPRLSNEDAFEKFILEDLNNIIKNQTESSTLKKNLIEILLNLRTDEIVKIFKIIF